jgi:hypothetical protein
MTYIMLATNLDNCHTGTVAPETKTEILVCNAGSSSFKFDRFDTEDEASSGSENPRDATVGLSISRHRGEENARPLF